MINNNEYKRKSIDDIDEALKRIDQELELNGITELELQESEELSWSSLFTVSHTTIKKT